MRLLIVEDEKQICDAVAKSLYDAGYEVDTCYDGEEALECILTENYDLVVLDLNLPGMDGLDLLRAVRAEQPELRVLILSARAGLSDRITGLDLGADDYLTKPFRIPELRARVNAHIRREQRERHSSLNFERIRIDLSAKTVQVDGEIISLTKSEYMICEFLARNKGQVFTREQIYEAVFSLDGESDNSTIATHIKNIRAKLNQYCIQPITTVWGIGYKWE